MTRRLSIPCRARLTLALGLVAVVAASAGCHPDDAPPGGTRHFDPRMPRQLWQWAAPPPASVGMPAAEGNTIVFTSALSRLVSIDASGRQLWVAERRRLRDVAPRIAGDLVVAATEDGLAAFDRSDGSPRWTANLGERANTPALSRGVLVTSTWDGSLAGIALGTGEIKWRVPIGGAALGPAAASEAIAVTSWVAEDGSRAGLLAVGIDDGRQLWASALDPNGVSGPGIAPGDHGGTVVVVAGDVAAHGFAADSGREVWRTKLGGAGSPEVLPLPLGEAKVLVGHRLGGLALLDTSTGAETWHASSDGAAVRGAPAGPGPRGRFAMPLDDGRVLIAGPKQPTSMLSPAGRVSGAARGPSGILLVGTREARQNGLIAYAGW